MKSASRDYRVLALAPSSRGFGFAVLETGERLVDWGVKSVKADKNVGSMLKVKDLIAHYRPGVLVLKDCSGNNNSSRLEALIVEIMTFAQGVGIKTTSLSRGDLRETYFLGDQGTKHQIAEVIAARFRDELGSRLPPVRRPWMSEDYRMDIFEAVALGVAYIRRKTRHRN